MSELLATQKGCINKEYVGAEKSKSTDEKPWYNSIISIATFGSVYATECTMKYYYNDHVHDGQLYMLESTYSSVSYNIATIIVQDTEAAMYTKLTMAVVCR